MMRLVWGSERKRGKKREGEIGRDREGEGKIQGGREGGRDRHYFLHLEKEH